MLEILCIFCSAAVKVLAAKRRAAGMFSSFDFCWIETPGVWYGGILVVVAMVDLSVA